MTEPQFIYEMIGHAISDGHAVYYGAAASREEAEARLARTRDQVAAAGGKVERYQVREKDVTGEIVAAEKAASGGFCPAGFYVPDWRDVHDGSILPGSRYWEDHDEWPDGSLGFVWGCVWGDDDGWKVQALDLSRVAEGVLRREERFGYLYLDTRCDLDPGDFIRCSPGEGSHGPRVTFSVPRQYDAITGELISDGTLP